MARRFRLVLLFAGIAAATQARAADEAAIEAGRAVYLAEGCINCHSQYVRPGTTDVDRWGPARSLAEALKETPPLFGNRRQGPDLQNVGNRRSRAWQRLHLVAPRQITPGSRMPSYAHLFAVGDSRGEALLDYLDSLGAGVESPGANWNPSNEAVSTAVPSARHVFTQWCAACHGESGRGDGPLAAELSTAPRNLVIEPWRYQTPTADPVIERAGLARVIKFGLKGTTMAGREYLSDTEALALAAYVQSLRRPESDRPQP